MSTEEQRAKWREYARNKAAQKKGLPTESAPTNGAPEFLSVETRETYVIGGDDGTSIALSVSDLEALFQWWKVKRRPA